MLARMHARGGRQEEFRAAFGELRQLAGRHYVDPFAFVIVHEARGENPEALGWLEKAYEERSYWVTSLSVTPHLDGLRAAPEFGALLDRLGLPGGKPR